MAAPRQSFVGLIGTERIQKWEEGGKLLKEGFAAANPSEFVEDSEATRCRQAIVAIDQFLNFETDLFKKLQKDKEILGNRAVYLVLKKTVE